MEITSELVEKVAKVARLQLSSEEVEKFVPELKEILEWCSDISKVETEGIDPSFHPVPLKNRLREDVVEEPLSQQDALKNSPSQQEGYFKGPKAV